MKTNNWHQKYEQCIQCHTKEWSHKREGYCNKCEPLVRKQQIIDGWNANDKATHKKISFINADYIDMCIKRGTFDQVKTLLKEQISKRLEHHRQYNDIDQSDSLDIHLPSFIENLLNQISPPYAPNLFHNATTRYLIHFDTPQRKIIYKDLLYIIIHQKFKFNIGKEAIR